jgi:hypothetical protein
MARPRMKIDIAELEKLYQLQCTDKEVAAFLGISVKTLDRRKKIPKFSDAMNGAKAKGLVSVRRMLFSLGAKGNVAAAIFLAKNLLGYKDYAGLEHSGPGGGPLVPIDTARAILQTAAAARPIEDPDEIPIAR